MSRENRPYQQAHDYAAPTSSDIDLLTDPAGPADGDPARRLIALEAGTLVIVFANGKQESFTVAAAHVGTLLGVWEAHQIMTIKAATDIDTRVSW